MNGDAIVSIHRMVMMMAVDEDVIVVVEVVRSGCVKRDCEVGRNKQAWLVRRS